MMLSAKSGHGFISMLSAKQRARFYRDMITPDARQKSLSKSAQVSAAEANYHGHTCDFMLSRVIEEEAPDVPANLFHA